MHLMCKDGMLLDSLFKGEALVDGSALKWQYYNAFDNLSKEEIENLSANDVKKLEEKAMELNALHVAKDVQTKLDDEPCPAGDFMKAYVTADHGMLFYIMPTFRYICLYICLKYFVTLQCIFFFFPCIFLLLFLENSINAGFLLYFQI